MNLLLRKIIKKLAYCGCLNFISDEKYLHLLFWAHMNRKLNLENPVTLNEKLQWLKLNNKQDDYVEVVDKIRVKWYVSERIGEKYILPTLGMWESFDNIDFQTLPEQFVLKCSHDSGGIVICKDKQTFDVKESKKIITKSLRTNYFYSGREYPYKNIKPVVFAEPFIGKNGRVPEDYKFFTFNGEIDSVMVCKDRDLGYPNFYFYDLDWKRKIYQHAFLEKEDEIDQPPNFNEMVRLVKILAKDFVHARIDFYNIDGEIYFSEITLFNQSGFDTDITYETDLLLGKKVQF